MKKTAILELVTNPVYRNMTKDELVGVISTELAYEDYCLIPGKFSKQKAAYIVSYFSHVPLDRAEVLFKENVRLREMVNKQREMLNELRKLTPVLKLFAQASNSLTETMKSINAEEPNPE